MKTQRHRAPSACGRARTWARTAILGLALIALIGSGPATADVNVERTGSENPMKEIATSTIYGGLAGLILGGATALVVEDNEESIIKGFFVGGVFFGFAYGVYHVSTRPRASGLVNLDETGRASIGVPLPALDLTRRDGPTLGVTLLSIAF